MATRKTNRPATKTPAPATTKKGKTAKELVSRHIRNEKDVITEEEFKEMVIETGLPDEEGTEPLEIPAQKNRPKDEEKDNATMTPWDVISE